MDSGVSLRDESPRSVAYLERQGPYAGVPDAITALVQHLQRHRMAPGGPPIGVFYTDPEVVPEEDAQWEVRMALAKPAPESPPGEDGVGVRRQPSRTVAVIVHIGPYSAVGPTYASTRRWIEDHGYTVVGPPEEAYLSPPETPEGEIRTEIRFPVAMEPVALGG